MHKRTNPLTKHSFSTESFLNCNSFILGKQHDYKNFLKTNKHTDNKENVRRWRTCSTTGNMCVFADVLSLLRSEVICWLVMSALFGTWIWKKSNKSGLNKLHLLAIIEVSQMGEIGSSRPPPSKKNTVRVWVLHKNRHNAKPFRKIINIISGF